MKHLSALPLSVRFFGRHFGRLFGIALIALPVVSCRSMYYSTMESFGVHKREILVDRVEDARDAQEAAKEQFESMIEAFREAEDFDDGELEGIYDRLKKELDLSERRAKAVEGRIESIETVAGDYFEEWESELIDISATDLRMKSERKMMQTRVRYNELIESMELAEASMEPVLVVFRDHVLFLKHNLNAQAMASLEGSLASIEGQVRGLIEQMVVSIAEADAFITTIEGVSPSSTLSTD